MDRLERVIGWRDGASAEAQTATGGRVRVTYYHHSYKNFWIFYDLTQPDLCDDDVHRVFQLAAFEREDFEDELAYALTSYYGLDVNAPIWGRGGL